MTKIHRVLFAIGFGFLLVAFLTNQVIWVTMSQPLRILWDQQVGVAGDVLWITLIVGIVLTGIGYWKKPRS